MKARLDIEKEQIKNLPNKSKKFSVEIAIQIHTQIEILLDCLAMRATSKNIELAKIVAAALSLSINLIYAGRADLVPVMLSIKSAADKQLIDRLLGLIERDMSDFIDLKESLGLYIDNSNSNLEQIRDAKSIR